MKRKTSAAKGAITLQDHFRPPLSARRHWHAFHNAWATYLAADLNRRLPEGYFAEANVQFGIEIDVAAFDNTEGPMVSGGWSPPPPTLSIPLAIVSDVVEVQVFSKEGGPLLAGAIELVSPANKDRRSHRDAFNSKCAAFVQQGIGLVVVDVVTERKARLHDELLARLDWSGNQSRPGDLYAAAYRAIERDSQFSLDLWHVPLSIGASLPTLPLWLRGELCLPVELQTTYERTCLEHRIATASPTAQ